MGSPEISQSQSALFHFTLEKSGDPVIDLDLVAAPDEVTALGQELQLCFKVDVEEICKDDRSMRR